MVSDEPADNTMRIFNIALAILCQAVNLLPKFTDLSEHEVSRAIDETEVAWNAARA